MAEAETLDVRDADVAAASESDSAARKAYESDAYKWYVLAVLAVVYGFNFIDRQLLVILQEPIKAELMLSDTQLGLLTGFAFVVFYVICGIPIARLADRGNRRTIIAIALSTWSIMTALTGMAQNYTQMVLTRIGVGIGEAGGSPPSHSMISDMFAPNKRATALAVYASGVYLGILAGYVIGGWLSQYIGWRKTFLVVGLPGVLLAVLVRMTIKEPPRGFSQDTPVRHAPSMPSFMEVLHVLWSRPAFRHLCFAASAQGMVGYGTGNWMPSYYLRNFDISLPELATWLGLVSGLAGIVGVLLGGYLVDRLSVKDLRWMMWLPGITLAMALPFTFVVLNTQNIYFSLLISSFPTALLAVYTGPVLATTHNLVGMRMRALSSAILFLIINLIGMGIGPLAVGFLSDMLMPVMGDASLRIAIQVMVIIGVVWGCTHYVMAARTLREDLANAPD